MSVPSMKMIKTRLEWLNKLHLDPDRAAKIVRQAMEYAETGERGDELEMFVRGRFGSFKNVVPANWNRTDIALAIMDAALETFGVEYAANTDTAHGDEGFSYLNTGDTYASTVIYDHRSGAWRIGSWGDLVEAQSRRFAERNPQPTGSGHHVTFRSTHGGHHWPFEVIANGESHGVVIKSGSGRWAGKRHDNTQGPWFGTRMEAANWLIYGESNPESVYWLAQLMQLRGREPVREQLDSMSMKQLRGIEGVYIPSGMQKDAAVSAVMTQIIAAAMELEARHRQHEKRRGSRGMVNPSNPSMTYGVLPARADFTAAFEHELGEDGLYQMQLKGSDLEVGSEAVDVLGARGVISDSLDRVAMGANTYVDESDLWEFVSALLHVWETQEDDDAGDLASAILSTLGFEWV